MTVLLFDVFCGCLDGWIIRDINGDRFNGTFDAGEGLEDLVGFAAIFGTVAANEKRIVIRGVDEISGSLKADTIVGICTVLAIELFAWSERGLEQSTAGTDVRRMKKKADAKVATRDLPVMKITF